MMYLKNILKGIKGVGIIGANNSMVKSIAIDSRQVKADDMYIALIGINVDGHNFIDAALQQGASVIVCSKLPPYIVDEITYLLVDDTAKMAGLLLNNFYDKIADKITLIGITGTNGKTSTATLLFQLFKKLGYKVGLLSTVQNIIHNTKINAIHTTPDVVSLYALLNKMYKARCQYIFMECSSHAIHQQRISGLKFAVCVFTNITHDHLDYHKNFKEYINAKKLLFDNLSSKAYAVSNLDDKNGRIILQNTKAKKIFYSLKTLSDFKGNIISNTIDGLEMAINEGLTFNTKLIGEFNAYNLLCVYVVAILLKQNKNKVLTSMSTLDSPIGRFDKIISKQKKIYGIVDYAHTPDALEKILITLNKIKTPTQKIITVMGCGGDRDKNKRPLMAKIAFKQSDILFITSDNPRNENPKNIIEDMMKGLTATQTKQIKIIEDRKQAIQSALSFTNRYDIVLVAGKGHENYQEINNTKFKFNDKKIIEEFFETNKV